MCVLEYNSHCVLRVGNAVLLKPSEVALHTSNVMTELIQKYMDPVSLSYYHFNNYSARSVYVCACACARARTRMHVYGKLIHQAVYVCLSIVEVQVGPQVPAPSSMRHVSMDLLWDISPVPRKICLASTLECLLSAQASQLGRK